MIVLGAETHMASMSYIACTKKQRSLSESVAFKASTGLLYCS